ncbi:MAG: TIGR03936 family radical SAM-associated protein [Bacillota bacterium]
MYRYRIEYSKQGPMAYISHLDLTRTFERAARRAGLPVALSQGYHPHYKFSFGSVLPVGMEGEREYLDMELNGQSAPAEIGQTLQQQMPLGLKIRQVRMVPLEAPSLMALIDIARYAITAQLCPVAGILSSAEFTQSLAQALARESWPIVRSSVKGTREIEARDSVIQLDLTWQNQLVQGDIWLRLNASKAIRPIEVMESLECYGGLIWDKNNLRIRRTGLFVSREGRYLSPMDVITR